MDYYDEILQMGRAEELYGTDIYQDDNGTLYYHQFSERERLYIKCEDNEHDVALPWKKDDTLSCHFYVAKNQTFVCRDRKVYTIKFSTPGLLELAYIRNLAVNECIVDNLFCEIDDKKIIYTYGTSEDCIRVDAVFDKALQSISVHRRRVVIAKCCGYLEYPLVKVWDDNKAVIEIPGVGRPTISTNDSSTFVYFCNGEYLFALDTETTTFLRELKIDNDFANNSIVGVYNGELTLKANSREACYVFKAILPDRYVMDRAIAWEKEKHKKEIFKYEQKEKKLNDAVSELEQRNKQLCMENEELRLKMRKMETMLIESKIWALTTAKQSLKFNEMENLKKPFVCIQVENGATIYFDNVKPFELFTLKDGIPHSADLKLLEGEFDCSYRGTIGNCAYFSAIRGKTVKFFTATVENGEIKLDKINEMKTSEISLFNNQPLYFIERSREWSVYKYCENYAETEGERFDISGIDLLSKYERHYHRGILYLFRETATAKVERVNEKVVKIEGPLLDETSFHTPSHSDFIYILNSEQNVLVVLNTTDLTVSQQCYEPPAGSNNHSIVGVHAGALTMAFDGVWGRHLSTTRME